MSGETLLIEIGCEELPYRFCESALRQLGGDGEDAGLAERLLSEARLLPEDFRRADLRVLVGPRRIAVLAPGVPARQEAETQRFRGPRASVAFGPDGAPTKAGEGFARGKGLRERAVYLSPQAERALRAYLAQRPVLPADSVFLSYLGNGLSTTAIHKRLMRYRQEAGVSVSAHRLRHSFANDLLLADVPVTTIQKLLGHRWLETTQVYVLANDRQVQADYYAACARLESWSAVLPGGGA